MKSLAHLSRQRPREDEIKRTVMELHAGSDRVAAIMGSALVEDSLISAIGSVLHDDSNKAALFYDQGAPFGTFKARIIAAHALGLFDSDMARDLDIIRDIRNQFAHALLSLSFENEDIAAACDRITYYEPADATDNREISAQRLRFETACWTFSMHLLRRSNDNLQKRLAKLTEKEEPPSKEVGKRNSLMDLISGPLEGGDEDVGDDITPDKA
jgi:hypothetical protein